MKVPYDFLEQVLEVPALRLQAFAATMDREGALSEGESLRAVLVYAHVLKYSAPEIAGLLVSSIFAAHHEITSVAIVNRTAVVSNGEKLWDLATAKEGDAAKLQGIYEQHGIDLEEFQRLLEETYASVTAQRAQRRSAGVPRAAATPAPSDAPGAPEASLPGPGSA